MIARLSRVVPLLLVLAVVALVVYLVVAWRYSPNRGKEVLIRLFTIVTGALSAFFLIVCLYAWFDGNEAVLDLGASFLVAALVGLAVNRICRAVFLRHHRRSVAFLDAAALTGVSLAGDGGSWGGKCVRKRSMTAVRGICWRLPGKGRLCAARRTLKIGRSQRGRTGPQRSGGGSALHATP